MIPSNTLHFQYFWDFNKCLRAIFSHLSFENFKLYLLGKVVMTQNYYKLPVKVCELKLLVKQPDVFQKY